MNQVVELRFTVARFDSVVIADGTEGPIYRPCMLLARKAEQVVTDRLLVTDKAIRVLNPGR